MSLMKSIEDVVKKAQEDLKPLNEILENEMIMLCEAADWDRSKPAVLRKVKKADGFEYILFDSKQQPGARQ